MIESFDQVKLILDDGTKKQKIQSIEKLTDHKDPKIIQLIISKLDDEDIEVRGEAFSALVLNENKIAEQLIKNLNSEKKYVRGFSALILANRKDVEGISEIIKLTEDESSLVRSCALGALGYLKANEASKAIHSCFSDSNLEVKKSALKAAIDLGDKLNHLDFEKFAEEKDEELEKLLILAKQN